MRRPTSILPAVLAPLVLLAAPGLAAAKTSHRGWPTIDGDLVMHKHDEDGLIAGRPDRHNELLGGHGDDVIQAGAAGDVLWGDYKPAGNTTTQHDVIHGGAGKDFIYASHGRNDISTGGGRDQVHAHFGRGSIRCESPEAVVFLSHRSRPHYRLHGCRHISYRTVGY